MIAKAYTPRANNKKKINKQTRTSLDIIFNINLNLNVTVFFSQTATQRRHTKQFPGRLHFSGFECMYIARDDDNLVDYSYSFAFGVI